ncbi:AT-hook motif nuclear-localized protein 1 [Tanacetum coccineum]
MDGGIIDSRLGNIAEWDCLPEQILAIFGEDLSENRSFTSCLVMPPIRASMIRGWDPLVIGRVFVEGNVARHEGFSMVAQLWNLDTLSKAQWLGVNRDPKFISFIEVFAIQKCEFETSFKSFEAREEDVIVKVISLSQQGPRAVCILSANGVIRVLAFDSTTPLSL